jgi:signal transduction histidine kinase
MDNSLSHLVLQSRNIAVALTDRQMVIKELFGHQEIIDTVMLNGQGRSLIEVFPELLGNQQELEDILAGKTSNLQMPYINRDIYGKTLYLLMEDLPYRDEGGNITGIIHVVQDETTKGELEQQIMQNRNDMGLLKEKVENQNMDLMTANSELIHLNKFKAQFVHMATYELRNPLKALNTYVKMLLKGEVGTLTDEQSQILKIVQTNGQRVKSMTDELINAVSLESGQIQLELKPVDLASLVNDVVSENEAQFQAKKQTVDLDFAPELPAAKCDDDWVKQIVTNLLNNSIKFAPEKGYISLRLNFADTPGFLQLTVADTRPGTADQDPAKIFSGGMYITRSLVELNNGTIKFESQPDFGSVFHVMLPVVK